MTSIQLATPQTAVELSAQKVALQGEIPDFLQGTIEDIVAFLPRLVGAIVILLLGWFLGRIVASIVTRLVDASTLDRRMVDTPLGDFLGGTERSVANAFGTIAAWYIYLVAAVAAANALAISALSEWMTEALSYLPALLAGILVILVGFVAADFVGDMIERSSTVTEDRFTSVFADGIRFFLYFVVITIGLSTMGIDTQILYILAQAVAYGLGAALAIGLGIAIGLGGKDYVAEHIDDWMGTASQSARTRADEHSRMGSGSTGTSESTSTETESYSEDRSRTDRDTGTGSGTPSGE